MKYIKINRFYRINLIIVYWLGYFLKINGNYVYYFLYKYMVYYKLKKI